MNKIFKSIRKLEQDNKQAFASIIIGAFLMATSGVALLHGVAQWDLLFTGIVWGTAASNVIYFQQIIAGGYARWADLPFQDSILFRSTAGNGYDFFLMLIAIGWVMGIVGTSVLMYGVILIYKQQVSQLKMKLSLYAKN